MGDFGWYCIVFEWFAVFWGGLGWFGAVWGWFGVFQWTRNEFHLWILCTYQSFPLEGELQDSHGELDNV